MAIRSRIQNFGFFILMVASLLYVADKLDFIDLPKKLVIVLSLMTFTGFFILILIGAWLKKKVS